MARNGGIRSADEEFAHRAGSEAAAAAAKLLEFSRDPLIGATLARAMGALVDIAPRLDRRALGEVVSAPTNLAALLRVLEQPAAIGLLEQGDPLADARLRWIRDRQRLLFIEGRPLTSKEVEQLLGVTRQAVAKARAQGRLVGLPTGRHSYVYPSWQFGTSGPLAGLRELRKALCDDDPWMLTAFVVGANDRLDGEMPLTALRRGDIEAVLLSAAAYGEHGAA